MKRILIISGKGGTGKTVLTGAFATLAGHKVLVDCDVDAADLHLLLAPAVRERHVFRGGKTAFIDKTRCARCRRCTLYCRYDAIADDLVVDPAACEGCGLCRRICPAGAIEMRTNDSGEWFVSDTRFGPLVHARLGIAEENSGKLVSLVRQKAGEIAQKKNCDYVIIDGPPGIGCPVIASLSGVDVAVVVTEPTLSGLHDARRVMDVARHFGVPVKLVINKHTLNPDMTERIAAYGAANGVEVIGKIPFARTVVEATVAGKTIPEHAGGKHKELVRDLWDRLS